MSAHDHHCDWSGQPDIHIRCTKVWTTTMWAGAETDVEGVYRSDDCGLYAFDPALVTCPMCPTVEPYVNHAYVDSQRAMGGGAV